MPRRGQRREPPAAGRFWPHESQPTEYSPCVPLRRDGTGIPVAKLAGDGRSWVRARQGGTRTDETEAQGFWLGLDLRT